MNDYAVEQNEAINNELAKASRTFNKVVGKVNRDEAMNILHSIDLQHSLSLEIVESAINQVFPNSLVVEEYVLTHGIVNIIYIEAMRLKKK